MAHQEPRMMNSRQAELTETLVDDLKNGALTEKGLRAGIAAAAAANGTRQDLLYLHCRSTSPGSPVQGMSLFEGGLEQELISDPEEWPYESVLDAIGKGWRVISFPDMSLLTLSADEFHGLGFLFVLERWSQ